MPDGLTDEQVLFLSDIFPTGYMAAENANIPPGGTVLVFGCGPVGQFAIKSAFLLGAGRVIAVDSVPERLALARASGAETLNYEDKDLQEQICRPDRRARDRIRSSNASGWKATAMAG